MQSVSRLAFYVEQGSAGVALQVLPGLNPKVILKYYACFITVLYDS